MKNKIELQDEAYTCGISCIHMILDHFGMDVNLQEIKKRAHLTKSGVTLRGIIECFKSYGIEAKGYQANIEDIQTKYPCILLTNHEGHTHFIVLMKKRKQQYECNDPAKGKVFYTLGELSSIYLGKVVCIEHITITDYFKETHLWHDFIQSLSLGLMLKITLLTLINLIAQGTISLKMNEIIENFRFQKGIIIVFFMLLGQLIQICLYHTLLHQRKKWIRYCSLDLVDSLVKQDENFYLSYQKEGIYTTLRTLEKLPDYLISLLEALLSSSLTLIGINLYLFVFERKLMFILLVNYILIFLISDWMIHRLKESEIHYLITHQHYFEKVNHLLQKLAGYRMIKNETYKDDYHLYEQEYMNYQKKSYLFQSLLSIFGSGFEMVFLLLLLSLNYSFGKIVMLLYIVNLGQGAFETVISCVFHYPYYDRLYVKSKEYKNQPKEKWNERITSITFDEVSFSYGYHPFILYRINGTYDHHYIVSGENGSGKTTFLKLIANYYDHYLGHITYNQKEMKEIDFQSIQDQVIYLDSELMIPFEIVGELFPESFLQEVGLDLAYLMNMHSSSLSKGQYQLVVFLYSIFLDFDVYLLDECFNHLDQKLYEQVIDLLTGELFNDKIVFYCDHALKKIPKNFESVIIGKKKLKGIKYD